MDIIFEKVYVETPVDTDNDGKLDLIAVYIKRPKTDIKIPAIIVANPYLLTCNEDLYDLYDTNDGVLAFPENKNQDVNFTYTPYKNVKAQETRGFSDNAICTDDVEFEAISDIYDYFIKKGYASIFSGGLGTKGSDGIVKTGSHDEVLAFKAIIEWLNGNARAFTNKTDGIEVKADFCTGKCALTGKSYLGSLATGVATTGVLGLETIVPEAAISNWYEYYRYNGLTSCPYEWQGDDVDLLAKYCTSRMKDEKDFETIKDAFKKIQDELILGSDRASGNYNKFWDERNYLKNADKIKASVFIIHGLSDWNVKSNHAYNLYKELERLNKPRKMILHQGAHIYIYNLKNSNTLQMLEDWFDYYLKGNDNGIDLSPEILIQSNLNQDSWNTFDSLESISSLKITSSEEHTFIDGTKDYTDVKKWRDDLILENSDNNIKFKVDIPCDAKIFGKVNVSFNAKIDKDTAILSAMLVDLGDDTRLLEDQITVGNEFIFDTEKEPSKYKIISRGFINAQNRSSNAYKELIEKDVYYKYSFDMFASYHEIKNSHKLALIIYGIDADFTKKHNNKTKITVKDINAFIPIK